VTRDRDAEAVASPCISVCVIDPVTGLCAGCFRALNEIAAWVDFSLAEKRNVIAALPGRRSTLGEAIELRMTERVDDSAER
jgi:predicted Fe-S protein YdhL (DUF1289 family)